MLESISIASPKKGRGHSAGGRRFEKILPKKGRGQKAGGRRFETILIRKVGKVGYL
jgi:hypothetical protein